MNGPNAIGGGRRSEKRKARSERAAAAGDSAFPKVLSSTLRLGPEGSNVEGRNPQSDALIAAARGATLVTVERYPFGKLPRLKGRLWIAICSTTSPVKWTIFRTCSRTSAWRSWPRSFVPRAPRSKSGTGAMSGRLATSPPPGGNDPLRPGPGGRSSANLRGTNRSTHSTKSFTVSRLKRQPSPCRPNSTARTWTSCTPKPKRFRTADSRPSCSTCGRAGSTSP